MDLLTRIKKLILPVIYVLLSITLFGIGIEMRILWLYLFGLLNTIIATSICYERILTRSQSQSKLQSDDATIKEQSRLLSYSSIEESVDEHTDQNV